MPTDKSLQSFYSDVELRENVHAYLVNFLKEEAIKDLFDDPTDTKWDYFTMRTAKVMIDRAFENLDNLFGKEKPKPIGENPAR